MGHMNKKLTLFIIIAAILVGGYFLLDLSKSQPAVSLDEEDFVTHTSKEFSFQYPKNWFVKDRWDEEFFPYISIENYDPNVLVDSPYATGNYFSIEIVKLPNKKKLSLQDWIDDFINNREPPIPSVLESRIYEVDGYESIVNLQELILGQYEIIYINYNDSVIFISAAPTAGIFKPAYRKFLESFNFN